ncbi:hypothetical protein N7474_002470 [Penicillium riverlandense]|uniref:uncharacterized protein n=1 Tax=Penicillium riverlandense TaxID=1903569 RepID=UPI0025470C7B|nr:uncharacterized protein N7474_002470 [Penicillium riverlandense]KAJ5825332.1 hypothetical protein N7474_002470 [Penicillium riverlandense]
MDAVDHWPLKTKCERCDTRFVSQEAANHHMDTLGHWAPKSACETCNQHFVSQQAATQHMSSPKHPVPKHACQICNQRFVSQQAAAQHMSSLKHRAPNYACGTCNQHFVSQQAADQHMSAVGHCPVSYKCEQCDSRFGSQQAADKHMSKLGHCAPKFKCETCSRFFFSQVSVESHMDAMDHWALKYGCETCNKKFGSERLANEHMDALEHWPSPEFKCEACDRCYASQEAVLQHMAVAGHWGPKVQCETCDRSFYSEDSAKSHMKSSGHGVQNDKAQNDESGIQVGRVCQGKAEVHTKVHGKCDKRINEEQAKVSREPSPNLRSENMDDQECVNTLGTDDSASIRDKAPRQAPPRGNANIDEDVAGSAAGTGSPPDLTCPFCECIYEKASAFIYHLELGFCFGNAAVNSTTLRTLMHQRDIQGVVTNALVEKCQEKLYRCPNRHCRNEFMNLFALFSHLENEGCSFMGFEKARLFLCNVTQATRAVAVD